jgi:thymidylate synthase ThyX
MWKAIEKEYMVELTAEDGEKLLPEEARGILPNDAKTELIMTGYVGDWFYEPQEDSPEKAGFFFLRCAPDAQSDIRVLAQSLKEQMCNKGINRWK